MRTITLTAGQISQIVEVGPGTRITSSGNGNIEWVAGALADAKNGSGTWANWPKGSSAGNVDTVRRMCIRATATGAMTVTLDESKQDDMPDGAYWDSQVVTTQTNAATGATELLGPGGVIIPTLGANTVTVGAGGMHATIQAAIDSITDNLPITTLSGTVAVTNGSATITFSSAPAKDKVVAGRDLFTVDGVRYYRIKSGPTVTNGAVFNLFETYQGSTSAAASFSVIKPNPRTILLLPGVYDYSEVALARNVLLKPYVGITGLDRDSCIIRRNKVNLTPTTTPMVGITHGSWLRNLTLDSVDGHILPYRMGLTAQGTSQTQGMAGSSWLCDNVAMLNKDPNGVDPGCDYWMDASYYNGDTFLFDKCYFEHAWDGFSWDTVGSGRLKVVFNNPIIYKTPAPLGLNESGATFIRAGTTQTSTTDIEMLSPKYDQKTLSAGELVNDGFSNFVTHVAGTYGMLVVGGGATGLVLNPAIDMAVGANHGWLAGIGIGMTAGATTLTCIGGYINITGTPADASDRVCGAYNEIAGGILTICGTRIDAESVGVYQNDATATTNLQGGARIKGGTNSLVNTAGALNKSANVAVVGATSGTITSAET